MSNEAISGCHISDPSGVYTTVTNRQGYASITISDRKVEKLDLSFEHVSYEPVSKELDLIGYSSESGSPLMIRLSERSYLLDSVEILADPIPELVYASQRHSIADYAFLKDKIVLLAYEKRLQKASKIYVVDQEMKSLDSLELNSAIQAIELEQDYMGRVFLKAVEKVFLVQYSFESLRLSPIDTEVYNEQISPVIDSIDTRYYFSTWTERFPAFDYYAFDSRDSSYQHIHQVADSDMLMMCRAEYKYLIPRDKLRMYRLELETGVEKEVLTCMATFEQGLYYKELYAPLFEWEGRLYLFDHPSEKLIVFDSLGVKLDSVPIFYHQKDKVLSNHFTDQVIMDESTGEFYALFQKPGGRFLLKKINTGSGLVSKVIDLFYDYPTAVQIRNGEAFYTYRPFESLQKKYLYKESLDR